jgi:hypothetical protein
MAFIVDIRRGNLLQHLMYKAVIELSADRAEFVSRLFSKKRPAGLRPDAPVWDLFDAFDKVETSQVLYDQNLKAVKDLLIKQHGFTLSVDDLKQLEWIYYQFSEAGPGAHDERGAGAGRGPRRRPGVRRPGFGAAISRATKNS